VAEIVLDVEIRERTGTGGARLARREGKVPGILYGGDKAPVPIAVNLNAFKKSLYTGKLAGHLVTLKYGTETQKVIAKAIDFHPVTDIPVHFDLYRVDEDQKIRIHVPVHFKNHETSPGLKRGGALNVSMHEIEILVPAGHIPEGIVIDLAGHDIGHSFHIGELSLPSDAQAVLGKDVVVASITTSAAEKSAEAGDPAATPEA
jgi:large subunit ribosomal protein L25